MNQWSKLWPSATIRSEVCSRFVILWCKRTIEAARAWMIRCASGWNARTSLTRTLTCLQKRPVGVRGWLICNLTAVGAQICSKHWESGSRWREQRPAKMRMEPKCMHNFQKPKAAWCQFRNCSLSVCRVRSWWFCSPNGGDLHVCRMVLLCWCCEMRSSDMIWLEMRAQFDCKLADL